MSTTSPSSSTIARGRGAVEMGLADSIGDRDDVEERSRRQGVEEVSVRSFEPERSLPERLRVGAATVAHAAGAGAAAVLTEDGPGLR